DEGRFLEQIFDAMDVLIPTLLPDYVIGQLNDFITRQMMHKSLERAMDLLHAGADIPTVRVHAWAALNAGPPPSDVGDPWVELIPPAFDEAILPRILRNFVRDRARAMGVDPCGLAWSALSACTAAL